MEPRHAHTLSREKTGLVIIDMQEKFAPVVPGFDVLVRAVARLMAGFALFGMPVLATEQYPRGLGRTVPPIRELLSAPAIEKVDFSCACVPEFTSAVDRLGLAAVVLCGVETHVCVNQTALDLIARGTTVHIAVDAVGSQRQLDKEVALRKMEQAGAVPATAEMILFELAGTAGTESFRALQRIVKSEPAGRETITV